jgi:hypothetical protein
MRFIENPAQLLVRATIPCVDAAHAVRLAKLITDKHHGIADALTMRTVISRSEIVKIAVIDAAPSAEKK